MAFEVSWLWIIVALVVAVGLFFVLTNRRPPAA